MKIICDTNSFTNTCLNVQRSIPAKAVLPHLEGILIETQGDSSVKLTGFDLDIAIITAFNVRVVEPGAAVLNAKTFCDILRHLPDSTVTITCNEKNICTITSGEVEYTLISLNPAEYPELPTITEEIPFRINSGILKDMIKRTVFAVSADDGKTVHRGVKFELTSDEIKLIALDGYRLAIRTEFTEYNGEALNFVVPAKTLYEIIKLAEDDEGFIEIVKGRRHIMFNVNGYCLVSKLLEGEFLDYRTAFPKGKNAVVRVNTKKLMDSIERTSIIITEKVKSPIRCIFEEDELKLSAVTALGSASDKLSVSIDGERTEIGFNNRFLLDALRSCDTDEVLIDLNGSFSPAVITPPEGESFLYLILPVRIKND
ncbi:MAG: DNA polymerase III subunit beta [Clostridia bacterium]|nr:DNA polymerase III subunit beta [Clostridia bacterium]